MANKLQVKRSSVPSKVPTTTDLDLGEIAINTYDGRLFIKKNVGGTETIVDVTAATTPILTKNRIINGGMVIDQRRKGASVTPGISTYLLDRWRLGHDSAQRVSYQQVTDAPPGFSHSILCTVTTSGAAVAGALIYLQQNIEGINVADFKLGTSAAQNVAVSFWAKSSVTGLKSISLINGALNRSYCTTYNIDAANTWEKKTVVIPGDTTGTWAKTEGSNGLEVHWNLQVGSTYETTLNTWQAGRFYSASSVPDLTATNGATLNITGVQVEPGTATDYEERLFSEELALCLRHALPLCDGTNRAVIGHGFNVANSFYRVAIQCPVPMMAQPSLIYYVGSVSNLLCDIPAASYSGELFIENWHPRMFNLCRTLSGGTASQVGHLRADDSSGVRLIAESEIG